MSIAKWAQDSCKATGFVTTSRITHASPAGVYAHIANREWENDAAVLEDNCDPKRTPDIARQFIEDDVAKNLKVVLGCGRREFRNKTIIDEEGKPGNRLDGRDLIAEWLKEHNRNGKNASFVWNKKALQMVDLEKTDYLLGMFEASHCMYDIDIHNENLTHSEPSLMDMTEIAIKRLSMEPEGFFLFVESARIDQAHHETWTRTALDETKVFSQVVDRVRKMTNGTNTLLVVTSDHSHVMTYNGYPVKIYKTY